MVENFYYLVSSLPMMRLGERPLLDSDEFFERVRDHLDDEQMQQLESVTLVPDDRKREGVQEQWRVWETYARNILVRHRAGSTEAVHHWHRHEDDVFPGERRVIEEALNHDSPLQRERLLDDLRWKTLEGLRVTHEFDFAALIIYRLQLLLAEKWADQDPEDGMENLNRLVDKLEDQARTNRTLVE